MTARTTGRQGRPSRSAGTAAASKRPVRQPATAGQTATPAADPTSGATPLATPTVDGTAALKSVPRLRAVTPPDDTDEITNTGDVSTVTDTTEITDTEITEVEVETEDEDDVIDLTEVEAGRGAQETDADDAQDDGAAGVDPGAVPPIDAAVLLRAIMTPPEGVDGEGLTDALTGAVPTWRLDEEPIYLEVVRDLGVPALPDADGGTGEVVVGEVVG